MELEWVLRQSEGQFFERKSCYDRSGGPVKRRNVRDVARAVAETLAAMANADGGTLTLGIENDGAVTGVDYPADCLTACSAVSAFTPPATRAWCASSPIWAMREQGEGIPRMFEVMEREGLYPPELRLEADVIFTVTLRNTPVYSPETFRWVAQFESLGLSSNPQTQTAGRRAFFSSACRIM